VLRSTLLADVPHGFTGVAEGDLAPGAAEVRAGLVQALGGRGALVEVRQVHGARVVGPEGAGEEADALVSTAPDVVIGVRTADCVPILLAAEGGVAAVHAGWRGTAARVVHHALTELRARTDGGPVRAAVGPRICARCYEVGPEVIGALTAVIPGDAWRLGERHVDLGVANRVLLEAEGVEVELLDACTRCTPGYWSHRRDGASAGRQGALIRCRTAPG